MDRNRLAAFEALLKIEKEGAYSNLAAGRAVREWKPDNQAFVRNLVYGVLTNRRLIDYRLDEFVRSGIQKVKLRARILLRMGIYQIDFMDSVPDYAAVSETVLLSRKKCPGLTRLINGVLRSYIRAPRKRELPDRLRNPEEYLAVKYSCSGELAAFWIQRFGEARTESLLKAGNEIPELTICANTLKITRNELSEKLTADGFEVLFPETDGMPEAQAEAVGDHALFVRGSGVMESEAFQEGLFYVQDLSSMRAVGALSPRPGQKIMDVCSAPGGKSVFSSMLTRGRSRILSCDIYEHKLRLIRDSVKRLGVTNITAVQKDASTFDPELAESMDAVIADVPCSGLGVIRRRPEIKLNMSFEKIQKLPMLQYEILENAARYVRIKGRILYSTCTVSEMENEQLVQKFLQNHRNFSKITEQQLFPDTDHSDGFYFCVMERKS